MSEVNQKNMARWIVALRSGKYTQARANLRRGNAFCCLGVACEVSGLGNWTDGRYCVGEGLPCIALPAPVVMWLGAPSENPDLGEVTCIGANDQEGWSFNQIADALESRYLPNTTAEKVLEEK